MYNEVRTRPALEERLESIISGAALMADSSCTRDERRERIVAECNAVRQALQDLLSEYMSNVSVLLFKLCASSIIDVTFSTKYIFLSIAKHIFLLNESLALVSTLTWLIALYVTFKLYVCKLLKHFFKCKNLYFSS